ncbi:MULTISPECIES: hydroxyisourate hydrolase [Marinobacter]|uniref:5-hydroxyisourate hydrolase n=2 Tax=Marinobacter TaxID=2742 RepID=A0A455WGT3_MARNT|nr:MULTISPECIES: hydroxyisourate hydrolase [unclassified Marinobacter]QFS88340.1 5-hydroxyisourate hydrolase precursor [Marinobacter sp. THAF197a]QFT52125.1 5-hydroxyisourate hydrolase precursor [Marinobacter sp. THAF39]BBJ05433.1 5-hydroxyisourate hydrolase [Marinobacter nauticus]
MFSMKSVVAGMLIAGTSSMAFAAGNPLSVHVLNIENGLPSPDVTVTLERKESGQWVELNQAVTNEQGRIGELYPDGERLVEGTYRVVFATGDWFAKQNTSTFFPEIPVVFTMDAALDHYHVPLLLSPYGFSTYRGN